MAQTGNHLVEAHGEFGHLPQAEGITAVVSEQARGVLVCPLDYSAWMTRSVGQTYSKGGPELSTAACWPVKES